MVIQVKNVVGKPTLVAVDYIFYWAVPVYTTDKDRITLLFAQKRQAKKAKAGKACVCSKTIANHALIATLEDRHQSLFSTLIKPVLGALRKFEKSHIAEPIFMIVCFAVAWIAMCIQSCN